MLELFSDSFTPKMLDGGFCTFQELMIGIYEYHSKDHMGSQILSMPYANCHWVQNVYGIARMQSLRTFEILRIRAPEPYITINGVPRSIPFEVKLSEDNRYHFANETWEIVNIIYSGDLNTNHFWCSLQLQQPDGSKIKYFYDDCKNGGAAIRINDFDQSSRSMNKAGIFDLIRVWD